MPSYRELAGWLNLTSMLQCLFIIFYIIIYVCNRTCGGKRGTASYKKYQLPKSCVNKPAKQFFYCPKIFLTDFFSIKPPRKTRSVIEVKQDDRMCVTLTSPGSPRQIETDPQPKPLL